MEAAYRWMETVRGFAGASGLRWVQGVLTAPARALPKECAPETLANADTRYVTVDGQPVAYREAGTGEHTVVFLHGFGGRLTTWNAVQTAIAAGYRTIAIDLWGFGASARPARLTQHHWPGQVFGVMDALGVDRAVFAGHSLGGRVSLMCAQAQPQRVAGLCLVDADFGHVPHGYLLAWGIAQSPFMPSLLRRIQADRGHIRRLLQMAYGPRFSISDELVAHYHAPLCVRGSVETLTHLGRQTPDLRIGGYAAQVRVPTLVIWGEADPIIPAAWTVPLRRQIPHAQLLTLPGVGHFPQEEAPPAVIAHLQDFLTDLT